MVIDSTDVKVYGEGEWKTRQRGVSKRRIWRKLHLAVDEATGEILSAVATDNSCHDSGTTPRRFAALGNAYQDSEVLG